MSGISSARRALLIALAALSTAACASAPFRRPPPAHDGPPTAQLNLQLVDQLADDWEIDYVQVFVNGRLVWQGRPASGSRSLGSHTVPGIGNQEVYVRAVATLRSRAHPSGNLASDRETVMLRPGTHTIRIRLEHDFLRPSVFHVSLAAL